MNNWKIESELEKLNLKPDIYEQSYDISNIHYYDLKQSIINVLNNLKKIFVTSKKVKRSIQIISKDETNIVFMNFVEFSNAWFSKNKKNIDLNCSFEIIDFQKNNSLTIKIKLYGKFVYSLGQLCSELYILLSNEITKYGVSIIALDINDFKKANNDTYINTLYLFASDTLKEIDKSNDSAKIILSVILTICRSGLLNFVNTIYSKKNEVFLALQRTQNNLNLLDDDISMCKKKITYLMFMIYMFPFFLEFFNNYPEILLDKLDKNMRKLVIKVVNVLKNWKIYQIRENLIK